MRVGAFSSYGHAPATRSRWCAASGSLPDVAADPTRFVDAVLERVEAHRARVIIASHDGEIEALRRRRTEVESRARLALAHDEALAIAVSKPRTLGLAAELGIPVPRGLEAANRDELRAALAHVGFPAVLKPVQSWAGTDACGERLTCRVALTPAEALREAAALFHAGSSIVVQQWLPGAREAVSLLYASGTVWARFVQIAHRTHPPLGGSSVLRESIEPPADVMAAAEELVRASDLEGYSEIEFRRDAKGRPCLMEINPRLSASVEVAVRSGVDFPLLLHDWAAGRPLRRVTGYRSGVRMRWLGGDLRWLRETLATQGRPDVATRPRALLRFAADCLRPMAYDYLAPMDPQPMLTATGCFLSDSVRRFRPRRQIPAPVNVEAYL